jgi:hypothetical protein
VFELIASWGVDYVKVDDIARPYFERRSEIEAIRRAIDNTGRPMVLSLSPGATPLPAAAHVAAHANLWRISDDFWDRWLAVREQFVRLARWSRHRRAGGWPDADMLPFGVLALGERETRLTPEEQVTVMTLWSIARSPLMMGGDLTKLDSFTRSLLENPEVIFVNQHSENNHQLLDHDGLIAWTADEPDGEGKYLALFNVRDPIRLSPDDADFASPLLRTGDQDPVAVEVDVAGGQRLFLCVDCEVDEIVPERVLWIEPTLHFEDGTSRPLSDSPWAHADATWDTQAVERDSSGRAIGLSSMAPSRFEYVLSEGATRFTAKGKAGKWPAGSTGGIRFSVTVSREEDHQSEEGLPIEVPLYRVGFDTSVEVVDLWTGEKLGSISRSFAPVVPHHGARLYRLTPTH